MNMTPRIALYRGTGIIGTMIRIQTRSGFSHSSVLVPGAKDRVLESREGRGVQLHTLTDKEKREVQWFAIPSMTDDQFMTGFEFGVGQLGMPYDYWSVARFVTKVPAKENSRWFCSELSFKIASKGGIRLLERVRSAEVSPGMLSLSPLLVPTYSPC